MTKGNPLSIEGLTVGFHGKTIFQDVSLEIKPNEFVTLMGENGAGKTVLLEAMMG